MTSAPVPEPSLLEFTITHQKVSFSINLDDGAVQAVATFNIKRGVEVLKNIQLNARDFIIHGIQVNDQPCTEFSFQNPPRSIGQMAESDTELRAESDPLKYCNRWMRRFSDFSAKEQEIQLPEGLEESFTLSIAYSFPVELLNYGALSVYQSRPGSASRYIQLLGSAVNGHGRFLMPCLDGAGERVANWDLEFSVFAGGWQDCFDRLHVVSSGVLCRQFVNDERTIKVFHYKVQDLPLKPSQIAFVVGVFDAVKIPGVPFAYSFGPMGKSAQLGHVTDFLGKAFNFYNWYLNSAGGAALKSLGSLSSEVFPFPSYFLVFLKDLPAPLSAANISALPSDFLHDGTHIEQTFETRRALCLALAQQYFSLRIDLKSVQDSWLLLGITRYLSELQLRTFHGNNDYRLRVKQDILRLAELEATSENLYVPPLASLAAHLDDQAGSKLNPLDRARLQEILYLKSRLIFVLLERKIEWTFLQKLLGHLYTESLINRQQREGFSFGLFLKLIKRLTGKDLKSFTEMWISGSGCPQLSLSFLHNRKKSAIEFEVQPSGRNCKYSGNLTVRVQESDIVHEHVVHLDDQTTRFEVPFHSKAKKVRRKPTKAEAEAAAANAASEAANEDGKATAADDDSNVLNETLVSPISWIRIDPEMEWLARFNLSQPDIMWIEALENDRDVASQLEAVLALPALSEASESVCFALERFINDWKAFYAVRVEAIMAMSTIGARLPKENSLRLIGAKRLVEMFNKKFGHSNNNLTALPRANNFEIIANFFIQAAIAEGVSKAICLSLEAESTDSITLIPSSSSGGGSSLLLDQLVGFFASLLKFNDNSTNAFNDSEYLAQIIRAGTAVFARLQDSPRFQPQFTAFCTQLHRYARLEYILPSFRNVVMCAVLEACTCLRFPAEFAEETLLSLQGNLQSLLLPQNSLQVRLESCRLFSQFFREHGYAGDLFTLLQMMFTDRSVSFRSLAAKDASAFESLQFLMRSMDPSIEEALRRWCLAEFDDRRCLEQLTCALAALFTPASDEISSSAGTATSASSGKLKITFNLASQPTPATATPSASVDDDDDIWLREISPEKPGNATATSTINRSNNESEKSKLLRILNALWSNYDSIPFRYPVDPSVPGYYAIIKHPMDLSTIREHCSSLQLFLSQLRQMFQNCFTFNQPESLICEQAKRLRELAIAELREAFPKDKKLIRRTLKGADGADEAGFNAATVAAVPEDDAFSTSTLEGTLRAILSRLCKHPLAYFFLEPVDYVALNLPSYPLIIKHPMDFGTIRSRLPTYATVADFERDCRLVFDNCRQFNAQGTLVYEAAEGCERLFVQEMEKHFPRNGNRSSSENEQKPKIKISLNLRK